MQQVWMMRVFPILRQTACVQIAILSVSTAAAMPYRLLLESVQPQTANEVSMMRFASYGDLVAGNISSHDWTQLHLSPVVNVGGFTRDATGKFHTLLEANDPQSEWEIAIVRFNSIDDLINGSPANQYITPLHLSPVVNVGGLTSDGAGGFQMLLEAAEPQNGVEVVLIHFASYADLIHGDPANMIPTQIHLRPAYNIGGFSSNGMGGYHVLAESIADLNSGELALLNYATYGDLIAGNLTSHDAVQINVNPAYSVGGLLREVIIIPEPSCLTLLMLGSLLAGDRLRRRHPTA